MYTHILEKEMATHSSTLAWKIPWTEKHGRLQSMGSQRVGHDWATSLIHIYISEIRIHLTTDVSGFSSFSPLELHFKMVHFITCLVAKLYLTHHDPMDCSPPGSSVREISQARVLKWVAISFSRGSSWPSDQTSVSYLVGSLYLWTTWEAPIL